MQFKIITIFFILLGITSAAFLYKNLRWHDLQANNNTPPLVVGTAAGYAPYVSINEQGEYEGFDIDVANAIASTLNKKLELKDLGSMSSLLMALHQGSIDVIIWGMSITQDRLKKLTMVHYQGNEITTNPLIFWQKIPAGIKELSDMKGLTICVEPSSFQSDVVQDYKDIIILPTEKIDDALLNIQYKKADAALVDPAIAKKFKAKYPEIQIVDVPLKEKNQSQGIGIVIQQNNLQLIDQVQRAADELKRNGTISKFEKKWNIE